MKLCFTQIFWSSHVACSKSGIQVNLDTWKTGQKKINALKGRIYQVQTKDHSIYSLL